jgi:hypothetical protein
MTRLRATGRRTAKHIVAALDETVPAHAILLKGLRKVAAHDGADGSRRRAAGSRLYGAIHTRVHAESTHANRWRGTVC